MNIHEYQAKSLLRDFGIPVPNGIVIDSLSDLIGLEEKLSGSKFVVKSQIHAGGRGAGFFKDEAPGGGGVLECTVAGGRGRHPAACWRLFVWRHGRRGGR